MVVLAAALTGCGGGGDKKDADKTPGAANTRLSTPTSKVTEVTLDCAKYADTAQKIAEAQQELYAGSGGSTEALDTLKSRMDALKDGAPDNVKAAIDELNQAFEKVQQIIANPTTEAQQELAQMGPKLATDGQTITTYIVSQCKK
ncbi:hypothetical protein EFL95_00315 [Nocardioides marmorisolisilvae]|uniref:Uncharacterized protein n=1 Tax=Nocardioides marmorisolisilvae TaxID=1542737 RepID=A0A3N0DZ42_9ACTN|nr:hypothetical protein EFL95_00315 [Nocardioides marmorisolisilvae]